MGVKGLWRLLLPIGRRVSIETLQGKVIAIDASIWLTQFLKAMRDPETGRVQAAAHLIGFFRRLCRLAFHGIRPVFVFDGATPEIKQRELAQRRKRRMQFAVLGDAAVQRLARRLLTETLKKKQEEKPQLVSSSAVAKGSNKKRSRTSAFVAGFNPGESDDDGNDDENETDDDNDDRHEDVSGQGDTIRDQACNVSAPDDSSSRQPVISLLEEEDIDLSEENIDLMEENVPGAQQQVNDWDNPIPVDSDDNDDEEKRIHADSHGKGKNDDSSSGGSIEYEDFGVDRTTNRSLNRSDNHSRKNDTDDDANDEFRHVRYISSLPAHQRKDAIEEAKRRQRLASRREFMPAAGNPQDFSQVQVANFLRSSRLNQSIVQMATQAAVKDNHRLRLRGEVMASDRTTRVELIRETEHGPDPERISGNHAANINRAVSGRLWKKTHAVAIRRCIAGSESNQQTDDDESSRDEEVWASASRRPAGLNDSSDDDRKPAAKTSPRRRVVASDESSSSQVDDDASSQEGGLLLGSSSEAPSRNLDGDDDNNNKTLHHKTSDRFEIEFIDSSFGPDDEAGGFLSSEAQSLTAPANRAAEKAVRHGGLQLPISVPAGGKARTNSGSSTMKQRMATKSDTVLAQELADRALAEALQEVEDSETAAVQTSVLVYHLSPTASRNGCSNDATPLIHDPHGASQLSHTKDTFFGSSNKVQVHDTSQCSSDDEIDWEDGGQSGVDESKVEVEKQVPDGEPKNADITGSKNRAGQKVKPLPDEVPDTNDDEGVDWEDGDFANGTESKNVCQSEAKEAPIYYALGETKSSQREARVADHPSREPPEAVVDTDDESSTPAHSEWDEPVRSFSGKKDDHSKERLNAETAAALERAQATASNLANWAGRVFQRAMKEVSEANIVSSPKESEKTEHQADTAENAFMQTADELAPSEVLDNEKSVAPQSARNDSRTLGGRGKPTASVLGTSDSQAENVSYVIGQDPQLDPAVLELDEERWVAERNRRERDMDTVTDEMREEAIRLLQLFGVPYVEAPSEAEAQCVALEELGLVDGIVTDDSDVFVFGGKTVYKNIFDEMKYVEVYLASDAEKEMSLGRNHMVALAMLLGGDYTEGVKGVGIVNAMEILETFDVSADLKEGLQHFRKWLDGFNPMDAIGANVVGSLPATKEQLFHTKHRTARTRWVVPDSFPSDRVIAAFQNPVVDKSDKPFTWGSPDVDNLIQFCSRNMGWPREETMKFLGPVVNRIKTGYRQTRIDAFMKYDDGIKFADIKSKRLRHVLGLREEKDSGSGTKRPRK